MVLYFNLIYTNTNKIWADLREVETVEEEIQIDLNIVDQADLAEESQVMIMANQEEDSAEEAQAGLVEEVQENLLKCTE